MTTQLEALMQKLEECKFEPFLFDFQGILHIDIYAKLSHEKGNRRQASLIWNRHEGVTAPCDVSVDEVDDLIEGADVHYHSKKQPSMLACHLYYHHITNVKPDDYDDYFGYRSGDPIN